MEDNRPQEPRKKTDEEFQADPAYRATHGRDGGLLGVHYPNNRAGRRAMARTWRGVK